MLRKNEARKGAALVPALTHSWIQALSFFEIQALSFFENGQTPKQIPQFVPASETQ